MKNKPLHLYSYMIAKDATPKQLFVFFLYNFALYLRYAKCIKLNIIFYSTIVYKKLKL